MHSSPIDPTDSVPPSDSLNVARPTQQYTPSAIKRALRRASDGNTLNIEETTILLSLRGDDLRSLLNCAARLRDIGLENQGLGKILTYSKKVFIPITHLCRDRCHYCTFVQAPHKIHGEGRSLFLEADEIVRIAREGAALGCKEALFTLGDRPEARWPAAQQWLHEHGFDSTLDYVRAMSIRVLEETGLLVHLNPGVMNWNELARLKPVAPSMGLMLETSASRLFTEPGQPHYGSPDKDPAVRLQCLIDAGRHAIPFTTGLLIGIGETLQERAESIAHIRQIHKEYGHIQEVIIQNFRAKPHTAMAENLDAEIEEYLATIAVARLVLGSAMPIQAPPNLVSARECELLIHAGLSDWGGISPLTPDHVNPERPWPQIDDLSEICAQQGFTLVERLTAHPKYILTGSPWIDPRIMPHVQALWDPITGLAHETARAQGIPWQEPDIDWDSSGRIDLATSIDIQGRFTATRSDMNDAFGDWESIREKVQALHGFQAYNSASPERLTAEVREALHHAESDPGNLSRQDYLAFAYADGVDLQAVANFADTLRCDTVGDVISYIINRNINFSNICYTGCRFCAFAQRKGDADAFTLSTQEIMERVWEAHTVGATEVCMQGGIDPALPASGYLDIARAVKQAVPSMHIHAFSPMEIVNGVAKSGAHLRDWLIELKAAGLDSIPGTAAEILDDEIRWILTKGKLPTQSWVEVITTAHGVGIPSTSTMMYGHVDQPHHWVTHIELLKSIQDQTGGFTEFVPLPFVHQSAPLYLAGASRPGPTKRENLAVHALARIMLHGRINNIQTSWVKLGITGTQLMLNSGANDLGGTLMEETISRMAGSENGSAKTVAEIIEIAAGINRPTQQRLTDYTFVSLTYTPASTMLPIVS